MLEFYFLVPDSSSASNFDGSLKSDIEAFLTRNRVSNAFHNADDERGLNGHYTSKGIKGRNDDDDDGSVILQSLPGKLKFKVQLK